MTQPRRPKGTTVGGQYDTKVHGESGILLEDPVSDVPTEEQWKEWFSPADRATLTRHGVTYPEWAGAAQVLADKGHPNHYQLVAASDYGYSPDEAAVTLRVLAPGGRIVTSAAQFRNGDFERIVEWPEGLDAKNTMMMGTYLGSGYELDRLADIAAHIPGSNDDKRVLELAHAGVDADVAATYGADDDWWRAYLCRSEDFDPETARLWHPLYPEAIRSVTAAGWARDDFPGLERWGQRGMDEATQRNLNWAFDKFTKTEAAEWSAAGFGRYEANRLRHMSVPEASVWRHAVTGDRDDVTYDDLDTMSMLHHSGVDPAVADEARVAGITFDHMAPEVLSAASPGELKAWEAALTRGPSGELPGGGRVSTRIIDAWKNKAGITDPQRVNAWMQRIAKMPRTVRDDIGAPTTLGFINRHIEPPELDGDRPHPIVVATARALDINEGELAIRADGGRRGVVEECRTAFRRRGKTPPF